MVLRSDAIVVGEALSSYTQKGEHFAIETVTPFSISEKIKGDVSGSTINIYEPGGVLNKQALVIPGTPRFHDGEKVLLFLRNIGKDRWVVTDLTLGRFTFATDGIGQKIALRAEDDIFGWDTDLTLHREPRRDAAKFLEFLRTESQGGIGREDYIVPAYPVHVIKTQSSDLQLRPTLSPSGKTAKSYTSSLDQTDTGTGARWFDFPKRHTFFLATINTAMTGEAAGSSTTEPGAPGNGVTGINSAMAAWNGEAKSNVNYFLSGSSAPCGSNCLGLHGSDGSNTISFETDLTTFGVPPGQLFACSGGSFGGVLGLGGYFANIVDTPGPDGDNFYPIFEGDVEMDRVIANCAFPGFFTDTFISAVTHEIGHSLGLRHSDQTRADNPGVACTTDATLECASANDNLMGHVTAIMKSFVPNGISGALQTWDVNAMEALYPCTFGGGCTMRADFNADLKSDVIWRDGSAGDNAMWLMNGVTLTSPVLLPQIADTNWKMAGVGDFDGDGKSDVVWLHNTTGQTVIWKMNGTALQSAATIATVSNTNFKIAGVGDFDGDGKSDIIWRNQATGQVVIYLMSSATTIGTGAVVTTVSDLNYNIAGVGDFDGDGRSDVVWRNGATGQVVVWLMNGTSIASAGVTTTVADLNYKIVGTGDTNNDGKADIFWWNQATGDVVVYLMNGTAFSSAAFVTTVSDLNWHVEAVGDFDGNGKADLMWRKVNTGDVAVWLMNGLVLQQAAIVTTVNNLNWAIVAPR